MNAICVYVTAARLVLQTDNTTTNSTNTTYSSKNLEKRLLDLNRLLTNLRHLLSCVVCCRLLNDPYMPKDGRCQHNVCRLCIRGRKTLRPSCTNCKDHADYKTYDENKQIRCLLLCYKSLCEHIMNTNLYQQFGKQKLTINNNNIPSLPLPQISTQELLQEGADYNDILSSFLNDMPVPIISFSKVQQQVTPTAVATTINTTNSLQIKTPQALYSNNLINNQKTPPLLIKKDLISPPLTINKTANNMHNSTIISISATPITPSVTSVTTTTSTTATSQTQTQTITLKQLTTNNNSGNINASNATVLPTITYMGTPGVVVPIVSSSATTNAPLSIASSKLQSLNRHLIRTRTSLGNTTLIPTVSSTGEVIKPLAFKLALASTAITNNPANLIMTTASIATTTATVTSQQQIRNPPPIKTVSNGSAMYSVLYTGIGNKITIKRKTDGENDDFIQRKAVNTTTTSSPLSATIASSVVFRQVPSKLTTAALKRRGCRCGNATPTPGKLTCCGQRCPCYVDAKSCIGCKCRGCRNPHRPDGLKVRPVIPELACYDIQMADDSCSLSPNELLSTTTTTTTTITSATTNSNNIIIDNTNTNTTTLEEYNITPTMSTTQINLKTQSTTTSSSFSTVTGPTSVPSSITTGATLIPFRSLQHLTTIPQQQTNTSSTTQQQQQPQQQQTSNLLQRESVLIQNAAGKYQVVNVFTTSSAHLQQHHTLHTMPTLQMTTNNNVNNNNNSNNNQSHGNTFLLPTVSLCSSVANNNSNNIITSTATTSLPQIFLQQQQQTSSSQQTRLHCQTIVSNSNQNQNHLQQQHTLSTPPGLSLQLQQQLKQSSIITVHPINNTNKDNNNITTTPITTSTSSGTTSSVITLSPIIVQQTNHNYNQSDLYTTSDNSNEYININNHAATPANSIITNSGLNTISNSVMTTPTMVEVIDSNDL